MERTAVLTSASTTVFATPILDDFNRANASTLGANWSGLSSGGNHQGIISNTLYNPDGAYSNYSDMYWNPTTFGPDCEVYMTITTKAVAEANDTPALFLRLTNAGVSPNGYGLQYNDDNTIKLIRFTLGVNTTLGATFTQAISSGDKLGLTAVGSTISAYYNNGSGWTLLASRTDTTYSGAGYIGFYIGGNAATLNGRYDDFGGGTVSAGTSGRITATTRTAASIRTAIA